MTNRLSDQAVLNINSPGFESDAVNSYPPYAISYKSMSIDVGEVVKSRRKVDPRHYNAFDLLPRIITILHAKRNQRAHFKDSCETVKYSHDQLCFQICICYKGIQSELVTLDGLDVLA